MVDERCRALALLPGTFAVVQLDPDCDVPAWAREGCLVSVTRTPDELSIVCADDSVPRDVKAARGFRCLRVEGPIEFTETGVLYSLARPLAQASVSMFAVSTYDTDYLFLASTDLEPGLSALSSAGHSVHRVGAA